MRQQLTVAVQQHMGAEELHGSQVVAWLAVGTLHDGDGGDGDNDEALEGSAAARRQVDHMVEHIHTDAGNHG